MTFHVEYQTHATVPPAEVPVYGAKPPNPNFRTLWGCSVLFGVIRGHLFTSFLHCVLLKTSSFCEMEVLLDSGRHDLFKKALKLQTWPPHMSPHTNDPLLGTLTR